VESNEETSAGMRVIRSPKWTESARVVWGLGGLVLFLLGWIGKSTLGQIDKSQIIADKALDASTRAELAVKIQDEKLNTLREILLRIENTMIRERDKK
jgi:hypothetical protein